jgi:hypothetical protein
VPKRDDKDKTSSPKSNTTTDTDIKQQPRRIGDKLETLKPANLNRSGIQSANLRTRTSPNTNSHRCEATAEPPTTTTKNAVVLETTPENKPQSLHTHYRQNRNRGRSKVSENDNIGIKELNLN